MGLFDRFFKPSEKPYLENAIVKKKEDMIKRNSQLQRIEKAKKAIQERSMPIKPIVKTETPPELDESKVNIGRITVFNRKAWNAEKRGIDFGGSGADLGMAASSEPKLSPFNENQVKKDVWTLGRG